MRVRTGGRGSWAWLGVLTLLIQGSGPIQGAEEHGGGAHGEPAAGAPAHEAAPEPPRGGGAGSIGPGTSPPAEAASAEHGEATAKKSSRKKKSSGHGSGRESSHGESSGAAGEGSRSPGKDLVPLPPADPVTAEQILEVALLEPSVGPLPQGALQNFRFEIRNSSKDVVVLKELRTTTAEDLPLAFTLSGYGTLTYNEGGDAYQYDPMIQQATPKVFEHGVMLPGEARRIELPIRLIEEKQTLLVRFQMLTVDQFRRAAFVPLDGTERLTTFQHLQSLPTDYLKPQAVSVGPIVDKPVILWEELLGQPLLLLEQRSSRTIPLKPLPISLEEARKLSGMGGTATWWSWAEGWVVNGAASATLVTKQGTRMLPLVDPQLFRDIDSGRSKVRVKLTPTSQMLKNRFAAREGDGIYTFGDFIEVPRERLWELFDLARIDHLAVTREVYLFDAYYFVLTPMP